MNLWQWFFGSVEIYSGCHCEGGTLLTVHLGEVILIVLCVHLGKYLTHIECIRVEQTLYRTLSAFCNPSISCIEYAHYQHEHHFLWYFSEMCVSRLCCL